MLFDSISMGAFSTLTEFLVMSAIEDNPMIDLLTCTKY